MSNKKIFFNTIFLYFRTVLLLLISLYTTRIIYNILGVKDFGIFSLIAGFIILFSFLNSAMRSGTQRYLNYALSNDKNYNVGEIFKISLKIHVVISLFIFFILETVGYWILNNKLNIPSDRMPVANIVFQSSIFISLISVWVVPYQSLILAKEEMKVYAYIGICEAFLKLILVIIISYINFFDKLAAYSFILMVNSLIMFLLYYCYVKKNYKTELHFKTKENKKVKKEMIIFSGWNIFGQLASVLNTQGISIIFNYFLGVLINASIAISNQINFIIFTFVSNLHSAFNPQIVKSFAEKNFKRHVELVINSSKYSVYLITLISLPFFIITDFVLKIWLGDILPEYVSFLCKVIVICGIFSAASGPLWMSTYAQGNIKKYQIIISGILLLNLPLTWILLINGYYLELVFSSTILISILSFSYRFYFFYNSIVLCRNINLNLIKYFSDILYCILILLGGLFIYEKIKINDSFLLNIFYILILEIFSILFFYFRLNGIEKKFILNVLFDRIKKLL
ncbi:MAG: hypothetical protein ACN6OV_04255 [Acinetobacter sp.]